MLFSFLLGYSIMLLLTIIWMIYEMHNAIEVPDDVDILDL